jgi:hypothetical protein
MGPLSLGMCLGRSREGEAGVTEKDPREVRGNWPRAYQRQAIELAVKITLRAESADVLHSASGASLCGTFDSPRTISSL